MLTGTKIYLRAVEISDAELLFKWENNVDFWKFGDTITPFSLEQINEYVKSVKDIYTDKQLRLAIAEITQKETIGFADLFDFDPRNRRAAVGIIIGNEKNRNKGYGSECLNILCTYAFEVLGLHQLHCSIAADNINSIKLFSSCGFVQYGMRRDWYMRAGVWQDEVLFQKISPFS